MRTLLLGVLMAMCLPALPVRAQEIPLIVDPYHLLEPQLARDLLFGSVVRVSCATGSETETREFGAQGLLVAHEATTLTPTVDLSGQVTSVILESGAHKAELRYTWEEYGQIVRIDQTILAGGAAEFPGVGRVAACSATLSYTSDLRMMVVSDPEGTPLYKEIALLDMAGRAMQVAANLGAEGDGAELYNRSYAFGFDGTMMMHMSAQPGPVLSRVSNYTYDEAGHLVSELRVVIYAPTATEPESQQVSMEIRYELDAQGNWIRSHRLIASAEAQPVETLYEQRTLTYR